MINILEPLMNHRKKFRFSGKNLAGIQKYSKFRKFEKKIQHFDNLVIFSVGFANSVARQLVLKNGDGGVRTPTPSSGGGVMP